MLLQLPDELLLLVFSFIPARTLLRRLSVVCKRFHNLLLEEWAWKNRFKSKCGCYPLVSSLPHSLSRVQQACVDGDFVDAARRHERSGLDTLFLNGKPLLQPYCSHLLDIDLIALELELQRCMSSIHLNAFLCPPFDKKQSFRPPLEQFLNESLVTASEGVTTNGCHSAADLLVTSIVVLKLQVTFPLCQAMQFEFLALASTFG